MKLSVALAALGALALSAATPAFAIPVPDGTVSVANLFTPTVNLTTNPNTYTISTGSTFQITGTGGFTAVAGKNGTDNGTLTFSSTVGSTIAQAVADFFVFNDGVGGTYNFSVASVQTQSFTTSSASTSFALFLLGNTIDSNLGYTTPTPTSLTITTNSTGPSSFSSSQTLAIPPAPRAPVPEPVSLVLLGSGLLGLGLVRRRA